MTSCKLIQWAELHVVDGVLRCPKCNAPAEEIIGIMGNPCYAHAIGPVTEARMMQLIKRAAEKVDAKVVKVQPVNGFCKAVVAALWPSEDFHYVVWDWSFDSGLFSGKYMNSKSDAKKEMARKLSAV